MRIATWNVNSAKQRMPRLLTWLEARQPDVVCLQETKLTDVAFADLLNEPLGDLGYEVAHHGQGGFNGVALLSRVGLADVERDFPGQPVFRGDTEARAISGTCDGVRIHSLYAPNGREVDSDHYAYKLEWFDALAAAIAAGPAAVALCGDMNVAPADADLFDPAAWVGQTHVTVRERQRLAALGLIDVTRVHWPEHPRLFSYWDYRAGMFHQDLGMRIDLVLASPPVAERVAAAWVDRAARKGKLPSDHAPVIVDLDEAPDGDIGPVVPPPSNPRRTGRTKLPHALD
ncbi:exodeoxyribonuclease III [Tessaracoccus antarcticus]|uniref:Exodeoxyribonuclease III n=1 Tax=Tessaracoccus antarcticus TaxID=2479848 RepID=A0A3M0GBM6_9ACTN|nr:exodeoxyribonuclease III [Tessaracoccus antarcticus]RMB61797.1 exodeoxyribonuclease III [Tessaracoccus antarcticus]